MGPLAGYKIIEIAGIGPGPFCGMLLSDMGAEVIRVERKSATKQGPRPIDVDQRGRRSIALNLKSQEGVETLLRLVESADAVYEGFRPGVVERLGIGPEQCLARNPKIVYGRMTGWGQDGPMAQAAGHDINYIALSGALEQIGRQGEKPVPPLNLLGDYGGGAMFLAFGMVCALLEAQKSGKGQIVDTAMVDGAAALMAFYYPFNHMGLMQERGTHFLSGYHHSYDTYETKDGKYISVGALEPQFYQELIDKMGLDREKFSGKTVFNFAVPPDELNQLKVDITEVFKSKTRDEWCEILEGTDACYAPVLNIKEAAEHPHNKARNTFVEREGVLQHNAAPRFSRTVAEVGVTPRYAGEDTHAVLRDFGFTDSEISTLNENGILC